MYFSCVAIVVCLFSNSFGVIPEWSPDAAALRSFTWRQFLLNYIPFAEGLAFKSFSVEQEP